MEANLIQYLTDESGRRVAVQLPLDRYESLLEAAEMLEDIRAYDAAKADPDQEMLSDEKVKALLGMDVPKTSASDSGPA